MTAGTAFDAVRCLSGRGLSPPFDLTAVESDVRSQSFREPPHDSGLAARGEAAGATSPLSRLSGNRFFVAHTDTIFVDEPLTTEKSHITLTFIDDSAPSGASQPAVYVVKRKPGEGFNVPLTGKVDVDAPFSYLVTEPAAKRASVDPNPRG